MTLFRSPSRQFCGDVLDARRPWPGALGTAGGAGRQRVVGTGIAAGYGPAAERTDGRRTDRRDPGPERGERSEEQTSERQSLMRISYAVFCLKKNTTKKNKNTKSHI